MILLKNCLLIVTIKDDSASKIVNTQKSQNLPKSSQNVGSSSQKQQDVQKKPAPQQKSQQPQNAKKPEIIDLEIGFFVFFEKFPEISLCSR